MKWIEKSINFWETSNMQYNGSDYADCYLLEWALNKGTDIKTE